MNKIIKPYFNTPLDPSKTKGLVVFYDATTQQGGGYLADKVGNRHGIFYNSPSWDSGNSVKTNGTSNCVESSIIPRLSYPFNVSATLKYSNTGIMLLGFPAPETDNNYKTWYLTTNSVSFYKNWGISSSLFPENTYKTVSVNYYAEGFDVSVDGVEVQAFETDNNWRHNMSTVIIGARDIGSGPDVFGAVTVKSIMLFNRALSQGEIIEHYQDPYYLYQKPKIYGFLSSAEIYSGALAGDSALVGGSLLCGQGVLVG